MEWPLLNGSHLPTRLGHWALSHRSASPDLACSQLCIVRAYLVTGIPPVNIRIANLISKATRITENVHGKSKVKHREEATKGTSLDPHLGHIVAGPSMRFLRARKGAWAAQGMGSLSSKPSPLACSGGPLGAWCSPHHPGQAPLVNRVQVSC